jgi:hypothetical protein
MSRPPKDKLGATPGKLALVTVLVLVLVGVVASNWPSAAPSPQEEIAADNAPPARREKATPAVGAAAKSAEVATPFDEFAEDGHWPDLPMSEVTKFDPLAKAAWAQPAVGAEGEVSNAQISELLTAENAIIFMSGDTRVARIGENEYHIGDVIGRYQISDITSRGVVLSESK